MRYNSATRNVALVNGTNIVWGDANMATNIVWGDHVLLAGNIVWGDSSSSAEAMSVAIKSEN